MHRTTVRIEKDLKKQAEMQALQENTTFQKIVNNALRIYIQQTTKKQAKELVFHTHDIGVGLDKLTREDYYEDPKFL